MEPLTKKEKVKKYFLLTGMLNRSLDMLNSFIAQLASTIEEDVGLIVKENLKEKITKLSSDYEDKKIEKYCNELDDVTLDALIVFFSSDAGRLSIQVDNKLNGTTDVECNNLLKTCVTLFNNEIDVVLDEEDEDDIANDPDVDLFSGDDNTDDGLLDKYKDL